MQSHTENVESAADIPLATESAQTHPKNPMLLASTKREME